MRLLPIPLFIIVIAIASTAVLSTSDPAEADTIAIDTGSNWFCSSAFQEQNCVTNVTAGDTVTWTVVEGFHTVTECDAGHVTCGNGFNSGILELGESFAQTFNSPGSYSYYCGIHPDMTGQINVQEPTPTPAPTPTLAPGSTPAPTAVQSPGNVPQTGGQPTDGGGSSLALFVLAAGVVLMIGGGSALVAVRRR